MKINSNLILNHGQAKAILACYQSHHISMKANSFFRPINQPNYSVPLINVIFGQINIDRYR
ncbi:hypothetical protein DERF_012678 [Dermatophagoides farinae]|uniref:Uncharacterized protein n=1 Tax=Dermatophagoides farinae TaxID=6954 RepID=A0A922HT28_DERFA|nr:hypothetical protein DERF_012678 [Dermatophagoides farinae]